MRSKDQFSHQLLPGTPPPSIPQSLLSTKYLPLKRIQFDSASKCTEILNRGAWLFKDDWLALAPFDPALNAQDHAFNIMNVWVRIHDIPYMLMDSDSMAIQTGSSLGSLIGTKLANLGKEIIEESVHSSDEASVANNANLTPNLPDPLDDFLNEEEFFLATLDVLAPTPLLVVKPNGETIVEESPTIRANPIALESTISPTAPVQRGTKRQSPMVAASKAKKTRTTNPPSNVKAGMSNGKNSSTVVDNQPRRGT
ncbi:hypothetical protein V6N11_022326 [Hibiscus sabdariffa]|uniref:DUF4283 domain-containing protein n=1 Tax=Hibiscus sabdariffa TaxID=183260 RepID=A0ABR2TJE9_9ROSI